MQKNKNKRTSRRQHGGGPKTAAGKDISKKNATKSGLFSSQLLIKTKIYSEDEETFRRREEDLRAQLCPEGFLEESCIERILYYSRRLDHTNMYEVGWLEAELRVREAHRVAELTALQDELDQKERLLQDIRRRREEVISCESLDPEKLSDAETNHLWERAESEVDDQDRAALGIAAKLNKLIFFGCDKLGWDVEKVRTMLATNLDGLIAEFESELSADRSFVQAEAKELADGIKTDAPHHLLVEPAMFESIERARSSFSKKLQRETETLIKLQAFRLQKMRLESMPLQLEDRTN